MKFKILTLFFYLIILNNNLSQIVNIEKLRFSTIERGIKGEISANFSYLKNDRVENLNLEKGINLGIFRNKNKFFIFTIFSYNKLKSEGEKIVYLNNQFTHIRHNLNISPKIDLESIFQLQRYRVQQIELRTIGGIGLRFKLVPKDSLNLYFGTLIIYENEISNDVYQNLTIKNTYKDYRSSSYISLNFKRNKGIQFNHTFYYQPKIFLIKDFRISSESNLNFNINSHISLNINSLITHDSNPPIGVDKTIIRLINGLEYSF